MIFEINKPAFALFVTVNCFVRFLPTGVLKNGTCRCEIRQRRRGRAEMILFANHHIVSMIYIYFFSFRKNLPNNLHPGILVISYFSVRFINPSIFRNYFNHKLRHLILAIGGKVNLFICVIRYVRFLMIFKKKASPCVIN
jgi:hypothetical protein